MIVLVLEWRAVLRAETAVAPGVVCVHEVDVVYSCAPLRAFAVAEAAAARLGREKRYAFRVVRVMRDHGGRDGVPTERA